MEKTKPIRILHMIASLYYGGSQSMVMNLYKNIDRNRIQFDFIVDHPEYDNYLPLVEELGGKVYTMPSFNGANICEVKKAWNNFFDEHQEYKILHSHSRSYASIYIPIAKKHGLKTIIHSHNTSNGSGIKSMMKGIMQFPLRYQADYFFACSYKAGEWLFGKKVTKSSNFYVINNAIDAEKFKFDLKTRNEYRNRFNVENKKVLIQVGEFNEQKNHLFTIELLSELLKSDNNYVLFLVGKGELEKQIDEKISKLNIRDSVVKLGFRDDVNKLLQMADYYLMPSKFEGLSVAAIEAQASGIPCLFSDCITKDVKVTNNCKFLPLNISMWKNEIINTTQQHTDTFDEIVKANFDVKKTALELSDFYERII